MVLEMMYGINHWICLASELMLAVVSYRSRNIYIHFSIRRSFTICLRIHWEIFSSFWFLVSHREYTPLESLVKD